MIIDDYFAAMERGLRQNIQVGRVEEPITCLAADDYNGLIRCRIFFWDGSYLVIYEVVSTELGYPVRVHYSYTYLREGQRVFRYDNAPHHPEIATHPHHKHIGTADRLAPADGFAYESEPGVGRDRALARRWRRVTPGLLVA